MLADETIAFIGGGNMAEALIRGLVDKADIESAQIGVSEPRKGRIALLRTTLTSTVEAAACRASELGDKG